jgi:hypothetical protein
MAACSQAPLLGSARANFLEADLLPASPAVRLTHDFQFASVTGEIAGTSIVYLPYPYFMLRPSVFLTSTCLSITVTLAVSQQVESGNSDGLILTQKPCALGPYDAQSAFTQRFYSRGEYESARSSPSADCFRITYSSDGLRVVGYLVKPRGEAGRQYPIIIYNRGGFLRSTQDR